MNYVWKILELYAADGQITSAKYHCAVIDGDDTVETEGYWDFPEGGTVPFDQVTEEMVAGWIEQASIKDRQSVIKSRLAEQLQTKRKPVPAPWMPQVYQPNI